MKIFINTFLFLLSTSFNVYNMDKKEFYKKVSPEELAVLRKQPFAYQKLPIELQHRIREFGGLQEPANKKWGHSLLQQAIYDHDTDRVQILIALGVNPNATPYQNKCNPLTLSILQYSLTEFIWQYSPPENEIKKRKQINIVSYLLKHGADVNLKNKKNDKWCHDQELVLFPPQESPLFQAVESSINIPILQILLQHPNIDLTIQNGYGKTVGDIVNSKINDNTFRPDKRKQYYKMATMLKNAQAKSDIPLNSLPSDVIMEIEFKKWFYNK